jgi:hypothetical protein
MARQKRVRSRHNAYEVKLACMYIWPRSGCIHPTPRPCTWQRSASQRSKHSKSAYVVHASILVCRHQRPWRRTYRPVSTPASRWARCCSAGLRSAAPVRELLRMRCQAMQVWVGCRSPLDGSQCSQCQRLCNISSWCRCPGVRNLCFWGCNVSSDGLAAVARLLRASAAPRWPGSRLALLELCADGAEHAPDAWYTRCSAGLFGVASTDTQNTL